jgi:hypothetical protein
VPVSVRFEWDPNAMENIKHEAMRNWAAQVDETLAAVRCPAHPDGRMRVAKEGDDYRITGCCRKGLEAAEAATGLNVQWPEGSGDAADTGESKESE